MLNQPDNGLVSTDRPSKQRSSNAGWTGDKDDRDKLLIGGTVRRRSSSIGGKRDRSSNIEKAGTLVKVNSVIEQKSKRDSSLKAPTSRIKTMGGDKRSQTTKSVRLAASPQVVSESGAALSKPTHAATGGGPGVLSSERESRGKPQDDETMS